MKFFVITFRLKVLLFVTAMVCGPVLLLGGYFYGFLRTETLKNIEEEVKFENRLFSFLVSDSQLYAIREIAYDLQIKRDILKSHALMIANVLNRNSGVDSPLMRSLLKTSLTHSMNDNNTTFFIFDTKHGQHFFLHETDRRYLEAVNRLHTQSLSEFLSSIYTTESTFAHFYFSLDYTALLVGVYPLSQKDQLLICVEDLSVDMVKYERNSAWDILNNVDLFLQALEYMDDNLTFVLTDRQGKVLHSNVDGIDSPFPAHVLAKTRQDLSWLGVLRLNNDKVLTSISYLPSLEWFLAVFKNPDRDLNELISNMLRVLLLTIWVAFCGLLSSALLLKTPLKRLQLITDSARLIENAGLKNARRLSQISKNLPESGCGSPDIDRLVQAFKHMTSSLSANMQNIIDLNNEQKRLEGELNAAHRIQAGMLPDNLTAPEFEPYELVPSIIYSSEVGGDLYDAIPLPGDRLAVIIGGVSDHGVPAALLMTMTITLVRQGLSMQLPPDKLVTEVNRALCLHNLNMLQVTLFIGILHRQQGTLTYANAGHCAPLIGSPRGIRTLKGMSGPALGMMEGREYLQFEEVLEPYETLLLHTSGLTEAKNAQGEEFGQQRLEQMLLAQASHNASLVSAALTSELEGFIQGTAQADDITMFVIKHRG